MSSDEAQEFLKRLVEQAQDAEIFSGDVRQRIYETAEANPFVMEWIVAQIDAAQDLDTVLEELKHGEGDAAERIFDRSFNLPQLGDDGRDTLLARSLFTPSATREALAAVAGFEADPKRLNEAISSLRALRLIKGIDQNRRLAIEGLMRALAAARLSKDEHATEFKERFVRYFQSYTKEHSSPTSENYDLLETEIDNLMKAMDIAFDAGDSESVLEMASELIDPVSGMLSVRGYWDYAIQRGEQALRVARNTRADDAVAFFANNAAVMYQNQGELEKAQRLYNESLEISRTLGNQRNTAISLHQLAMLAETQGKSLEAGRLYDQSWQIANSIGDRSLIAIILNSLGTMTQAQGNFEEAGRLYNESLEIKKEMGDQGGIAVSLRQLAKLAQNLGEYSEAERFYSESLEIARKLGDQIGIADCKEGIGIIDRERGELDEARQLFDESLTIYKRLGIQQGIADVLYQLGLLATQEGDKGEAARLLRESLAIFERLKSPYAARVREALLGLEGEISSA